MNTVLKFTLIFSVLLISFSCSQDQLVTTCNVFVVDKTNSNFSQEINFPSAKEIDNYFQNTNPRNSREFWVTQISEVSLNNIFKTKLPPQGFSDNPHNRLDSINAFYNKVDRLITESIQDEGDKAESSIYLSLCYLLNEVKNTDADINNILLYSDLIENASMTTSFYNYPPETSGYDQLKSDLESLSPMPDLTGINIVVVYKPSLKTDKLFFQAKKFWKWLVNERGGTIDFIANI